MGRLWSATGAPFTAASVRVPSKYTKEIATLTGGYFFGGDVGTRTLDLCDVNTAL